jgi:hypothetical protein
MTLRNLRDAARHINIRKQDALPHRILANPLYPPFVTGTAICPRKKKN